MIIPKIQNHHPNYTLDGWGSFRHSWNRESDWAERCKTPSSPPPSRFFRDARDIFSLLHSMHTSRVTEHRVTFPVINGSRHRRGRGGTVTSVDCCSHPFWLYIFGRQLANQTTIRVQSFELNWHIFVYDYIIVYFRGIYGIFNLWYNTFLFIIKDYSEFLFLNESTESFEQNQYTSMFKKYETINYFKKV